MSLFHNLKLKRRKIDLSHNNDGKLYCLLRYFKLSFYVLKGKKTQDFNFKLDLKAPKTAYTKRKRLRLKQEDQQTIVLCLKNNGSEVQNSNHNQRLSQRI